MPLYLQKVFQKNQKRNGGHESPRLTITNIVHGDLSSRSCPSCY